jgi:hypothetical protein
MTAVTGRASHRTASVQHFQGHCDMHDHSIAFTTPPDAPRWQRWLLFSPLARIVIFRLLLVAFSFVMGWVFHATGWGGAKDPVLDHAMALRKLLPDAAKGVLAGTLLFSAVVGVLFLLGSFHVSGIHPDASWLPALLTVGLGAGIGE